MNLEEFRRRRRELTRRELWEDAGAYQTAREVRADMRRTLYDDIAHAAAPDIVAGFEVLLIWAATAEDDS
jgi:hypothetical protein